VRAAAYCADLALHLVDPVMQPRSSPAWLRALLRAGDATGIDAAAQARK
jgi:hypothetical protein